MRRLTALPGLLSGAVGALLMLDPFLSVLALRVVAAAGLVLTGTAGVLSGTTPATEPAAAARLRVGAGTAWLAAGLAVALWPGASVSLVTRVAGVALVVAGVGRLLAAHARTAERRRVTRLLPGTAGVVLGILALAWPSPTVFSTAVLLGVSLVLLCLVDRPPLPGFRARPAGRGTWTRPVATAIRPTLALAVLAAGLVLHGAATRPDAFYTPPTNLPSTPGALVRSQPLPRGAPAGARAWRILYTTTRDAHTAAVASALVLAADQLPAGARPVLAWAHGATGITPGCAPTLQDDPLDGAMPDLDQVLAQGWVVVATDYPGLGTSGPHPFLIGQGEARSVLDAVRAARHLSAVTLADRTVVWGHSQGGNAALWTGILAPTYAPEVGVIGVAALAPGSNLQVLARLWSSGGSAILGAYLITAYSGTYPDVHLNDYVGRGAALAVAELADRCLSASRVYLSGLPLLLFGRSIWATDPDSGPFGARLRENTPTGPIAAPVFIAQGDADTVVTAASQAAYVHERCGSGYPLDYRTYPGRGHVDLIASDSPALPYLLQWTRDRLDGAPAASTCPA